MNKSSISILLVLVCACSKPLPTPRLEIISDTPADVDVSCGALVEEYKLQNRTEEGFIRDRNPDVIEFKYFWDNWVCKGPDVAFVNATVHMKRVESGKCYQIGISFIVKIVRDKQGKLSRHHMGDSIQLLSMAPCDGGTSEKQ